MPDGSGFFAELRRRHVWRVAVAYAVVGWLVVQLASILFPAFGTPAWVLKTVIGLLAIGFPVALVLAWAFEIIPEGVRRTEPADSPGARAAPATHAVGRKLDVLIIVVLVIAVALLGWRVLVLRHPSTALTVHAVATTSTSAQRTPMRAALSSAAAHARPLLVAAARVPQKSVAVLPFANESGEPDKQYFSDGLSEDLITALSQFEGLKVISRNSAFQFRDSKDSSAKIGKLLGVAHLLEGTVRRDGNEVRVTATLVNASDGSTLWSHHYDRPYEDLFALQDAITQAVADALQAKLMTVPGAVVQSDRPPSGSLEAYAAYQHGIAFDALGTEAGDRKLIGAYTRATHLDPRYAAAFARLGAGWNDLAVEFLAGAEAAHANAMARAAVATALRLDPESSLAHRAHAVLLMTADMDWTGAEAEARRALQLAPNDAATKHYLAFVLASLGHNRRAVELERQALASDPRHANWYDWLAAYLTAVGRLDAALQASDTAIALQPGASVYHTRLAIIEILRGDVSAALAAARQEPPGPWHDIAEALAFQIVPDRAAADVALKNLVARFADQGPYQVAEVYALRRAPDAMFDWLDRARAVRDPGIGHLLSDPLILRYRDDPRFAAFCGKVGLPTTTDAVAMK